MALEELVKAQAPVLGSATSTPVGGVLRAVAVPDPADSSAEALAVTLQALLDALRDSGVIST